MATVTSESTHPYTALSAPDGTLMAVGIGRHEVNGRAEALGFKLSAKDSTSEQDGEFYNDWWEGLSDEQRDRLRQFGGSEPPPRTQ